GVAVGGRVARREVVLEAQKIEEIERAGFVAIRVAALILPRRRPEAARQLEAGAGHGTARRPGVGLADRAVEREPPAVGVAAAAVDGVPGKVEGSCRGGTCMTGAGPGEDKGLGRHCVSPVAMHHGSRLLTSYQMRTRASEISPSGQDGKVGKMAWR